MLRTSLLASTLAIGLAITGSAPNANAPLEKTAPMAAASKANYNLEMVFLRHIGAESAEKLFEEIDLASREGKPFDIMFIEAAGQKESDYRKDVAALNHVVATVRRNYETMLHDGASPEKAKSECIAMLKTIPSGSIGGDFGSMLFTEAAIRGGIRIMPIEAGTSDERDREMQMCYAINILQSKIAALIHANATLGEFMRYELAAERLLAEATPARNHKIANGLEKRFAEALELFPELRGRRELRAIGFLGLGHTPLYPDLERSCTNISLTKKTMVDELSISSRIDSLPQRQQKRDAYLEAVADSGLQEVVGYLRQTDPAIAKECVDKTLGMTGEQLEALDAESSAITNRVERSTFIWNRILGREYFRKY